MRSRSCTRIREPIQRIKDKLIFKEQIRTKEYLIRINRFFENHWTFAADYHKITPLNY